MDASVDFVEIDQAWADYSQVDHRVWDLLYARQVEVLETRASAAFLKGLGALGLDQGGIPDFNRLNADLKDLTGWSLVAVPGIVSDAAFFALLAERRFPAGRFIRSADQLNYLQEPDVFHDVFGHAPMLADPVFADYMQAYGQGGLRALGRGQLHHLARLYWYTVEFGLVEEAGRLKIYGAGIASSHGESLYALESPKPRRLGFDLRRIMRTPYKIDDFQGVYFAVSSLQALRDATLSNFDGLYSSLAQDSDLELEALTVTDKILHFGT
jgi:phenylalanine-4-hydroxylase